MTTLTSTAEIATDTTTSTTTTTTEDRNKEPETSSEIPMVHKTKLIQFLGRTTPIILQNDNGPCPLLAICNVLSLRNCLELNSDGAEVSQEKLLSLVAERLIDSNSNIENKDEQFLENQRKNISDAIDLLPRLTTGIDVNLKFRRIDDFEFTPECAIFDLLDIPLYHGWIVDPQDHELASAIGSKSYNTLMGELVSLETQIIKNDQIKKPEKNESFDLNQKITEEEEEEVELIKALKLSEGNLVNSSSDVKENNPESLVGPPEIAEKNELVGPEINSLVKEESSDILEPVVVDTDILSGGSHNVGDDNSEGLSSVVMDAEVAVSDHVGPEGSGGLHNVDDGNSEGLSSVIKDAEVAVSDRVGPEESVLLESGDSLSGGPHNVDDNEGDEVALLEQVGHSNTTLDTNLTSQITMKEGDVIREFLKISANQLTVNGLFCLLEGIKEREICVFFRNNHFNTMFKFEKELYILVTDQGYINQPDLVWEKLNEVNGDTLYMTANFKEFKLDNNINHSTPTPKWDPQNAMANTADYISNVDISSQENSSFNSDFQLAIALQQQEFEHQNNNNNNNNNNSQQQNLGSRLVTGPQVQRHNEKNTSSSSKQEVKASKDKDRCIVM